MRILSTSTGDIELKSISNTRSTHLLRSINTLKGSNDSERKTVISTNHYFNGNNRLSSNYSNLPNMTCIKIKNALIKFPKSFNDKYEQPQSRNNTKCSNIVEALTLPSVHSNKTQSLYSMKEILSPTTVKTMLKSIEKEERVKERNSKQDQEHFRTIYGSKSVMMKAHELLNNRSISPNRNDLIRYLKTKETLNLTVIKRIKESNKVEQIRTNKACQILLANCDNDKISKETLERKLRKKNSEVKMVFKRNVEQMKSEVDTLNSIINSYVSPRKNNDAYKEQHFVLNEHYWKKYDLDRLMLRTKKNVIAKTVKNAILNRNLIE